VLVLVLSLGVVSAHVVYWNMDGGAVLSYEKFVRVDRDYDCDRVKVVNGYDDWRLEKNWDWKKGCGGKLKVDYKKDWVGDWNWKRDKKDYYWKWIPHLREYEGFECYRSAPVGKLFYRKCPSSY